MFNSAKLCPKHNFEFDMSKNSRSVGSYFEKVAQHWLRRSNFNVIHRNWHAGHTELDIIAEKENLRVFVEVKYLSGRTNFFPESKINASKWKNILKAAHCFNSQYPNNKSIRYDVIAIVKNDWSMQLVHYKDAYTGLRWSYI